MGEVVDFVHYLNSGEVVTVPPCLGGGHNSRHVRVYESADKFFIYCHHCHTGVIGLSPDDFHTFIDGFNPKWICERPYHHSKHIIKDENNDFMCRKCMVVVRKAEHPSHNGKTNWYG